MSACGCGGIGAGFGGFHYRGAIGCKWASWRSAGEIGAEMVTAPHPLPANYPNGIVRGPPPGESSTPCRCGGKGLGLNGFHYPGASGCRLPVGEVNRRAAIDRITFLLVGLTDSGLRMVLACAESCARDGRDLSSETLAAEQQAREALPCEWCSAASFREGHS